MPSIDVTVRSDSKTQQTLPKTFNRQGTFIEGQPLLMYNHAVLMPSRRRQSIFALLLTKHIKSLQPCRFLPMFVCINAGALYSVMRRRAAITYGDRVEHYDSYRAAIKKRLQPSYYLKPVPQYNPVALVGKPFRDDTRGLVQRVHYIGYEAAFDKNRPVAEIRDTGAMFALSKNRL